MASDPKNSGNKKLLINTGILKKNACIVLVKTEWNAVFTDELEKGCSEELRRQGVKKIVTLTVPGAIEIPFAVKQYWKSCGKNKRPDGFIALGCVIRGDTPHFEFVSRAVTDGVMLLNLSLPVPTIFGVLTVDSEEQAKERVGGTHGHKGSEAAITAIKMINLNHEFHR